ncbi:MAG TPA: hypothetical protein VIM12_02540 [Noviherbaspirillum sp.]|jgi:hypothetical protein|uniref:hypothetical protein n=1 Tax=Noviherbaspirillum sp. TaxID=1926288 RepID=UPI002F941E06
MSTTLTQIIGHWKQVRDNAQDAATRDMAQRVIDMHESHPAAIKDSTPDMTTEIDGAGTGGSGDDPPQLSPDLDGTPPGEQKGTGGAGGTGGTGGTTPDVDGTPPPTGGGNPSELIEKYRTKLPENMPAVFDLQVEGTGKTLRQVIESAAEKTGTPAILLAGQAWQETKAGLYGKPELTAKFGKPGDVAAGEVLDSVVETSTINPGNGMSDSGILQVNPNTLQIVVNGGRMGQGDQTVDLPPHPELAGLDPRNVEDAFVIAGTHMKDFHDIYSRKDFVTSEGDAWDYALRAYVGGPGAVVPGNPHVNGVGGGDPTYVSKVHDHMTDFAAGSAPRWPA